MPKLQQTSDLRDYFRPIFGKRPWRARLGWGSFLTLDFGNKVKRSDHIVGEWHLWIRYCDWTIQTDKRPVVNSQASKHLMQLAARNLEQYPLTDIKLDPESDQTIFVFNTNV